MKIFRDPEPRFPTGDVDRDMRATNPLLRNSLQMKRSDWIQSLSRGIPNGKGNQRNQRGRGRLRQNATMGSGLTRIVSIDSLFSERMFATGLTLQVVPMMQGLTMQQAQSVDARSEIRAKARPPLRRDGPVSRELEASHDSEPGASIETSIETDTGDQSALSSGPMNAPVSDEDLMCQYRDGDAQAFETLYSRHKGGLFRYFARQCYDHAVAEELYQDVWIRVITSRERYEVTAKFTTWVYRIAHNRLIDHYRQSGRQVPRSYEEEDEPDFQAAPAYNDPARQAAVMQDAEKLIAIVEELPEAQREAFLLKTEGGMSLEAIADATGVNRETAKSRLRYAMNKIRRAMESES